MSGASTVWFGLGANLGDPRAQLSEAIEDLRRHSDFDELRCSRIWRGPYRGSRGPQPEYLNLCARARTGLEPRAVLAICHELVGEIFPGCACAVSNLREMRCM